MTDTTDLDTTDPIIASALARFLNREWLQTSAIGWVGVRKEPAFKNFAGFPDFGPSHEFYEGEGMLLAGAGPKFDDTFDLANYFPGVTGKAVVTAMTSAVGGHIWLHFVTTGPVSREGKAGTP